MKKALITGITGQDGSYLTERLLELGYEVHGLVRRVALEDPTRRFTRLEHLLDRVTLHPASLESYPSIFHVLSKHQFDECYHLAAQSFVAESFADGFSTMNTNINGTHYMLAALRELQPKCKFYFAGSSEMFGKVRETPQTEETSFHPRVAETYEPVPSRVLASPWPHCPSADQLPPGDRIVRLFSHSRGSQVRPCRRPARKNREPYVFRQWLRHNRPVRPVAALDALRARSQRHDPSRVWRQGCPGAAPLPVPA